MTTIDERLKEWATPRQCEYIDEVNRLGSLRKAARELKISMAAIQDGLKAIKKRAAAHGYAPEADIRTPVPAPFVMRGYSNLYDETGALKLSWVKTRMDDEQLRAAVEASIRAMAEDLPRLPAAKGPKRADDALLNLYTLTDCHVGMRAWRFETGADWDLDIAERTLYGAMEHLIDNAPPAAVGLVNVLGDWLHFDSLSAVTPTNGHLLDADGRYPKVVEVAVRILRRVVDKALSRHKHVILSIQEGNHDMSSPVWNRHLFSLLYENEPRLEVVQTIAPYHAHQHGKVMLCFHHGHLSKNGSLPLLFAATYPSIWGNTGYRYAHTGHRHHAEEKEHSGMTVTQHPTIAARDAYAARGGWVAERQISSITYHSEFGQVARNIVTPEMLAWADQ